jgi:hypothetical protein
MIEVGKLKQVAKKVKLITQDELFTSNLINYTSSNLDHVWFNVQHPVIIALGSRETNC